MERYVRCPVDEKFCRREICLSRRGFPECENSIRLIVSSYRTHRNLGTPEKELVLILDSMIKAMVDMLQVDKALFVARLKDEIQKPRQS